MNKNNNVKWVPVASFYLNDDNPRRVDKKRFSALLRSVFSFPEMLSKRPIVIDSNGMVLGGNQRASAIFKIIRMKDAEFSKLIGADGPAIWREVRERKAIPSEWICTASDFTDEQKSKFILADNNNVGEWDFGSMIQQWNIEAIEQIGIEVPSKFKVDRNKKKLNGDGVDLCDENYLEIKRGDLIDIGPHRLLCGDATDEEAYDRLFGEDKAALVFTDPPYGVKYAKKYEMLTKNGINAEFDEEIKDDDIEFYGLEDILINSFSKLKKRCREDCSYFIFSPSGQLQFVFYRAFVKIYMPIKHVIIWVKDKKTFSMNRLDYDYRHECILFTYDDTHKKSKREGKFNDSVWEVPASRRNSLHPTIKPVELMENAILNHTYEGEIVADIFAGSGSTMVAAHMCMRRCYAIEISEEYCRRIVNRMMALDANLTLKVNGKEVRLCERK
ncbi:MAG: site-specific DNA-methyltransferase [Candidatus Norongarragalinales archaeon]